MYALAMAVTEATCDRAKGKAGRRCPGLLARTLHSSHGMPTDATAPCSGPLFAASNKQRPTLTTCIGV